MIDGAPSKAMRSRRIARCDTCGLYPALCVCASLPRVRTRVDVHVVLHRKELFKSTNTGRIAAHMLERGSWRVQEGRADAPTLHAPGSWVLFPSDDALPLGEAAARGMSRLVVPDGTWQQARRMALRDRACATLPCVRIDATSASRYGLRRNARPDGLCTLEAIAESLRVLEGDAIALAMLGAFALWLTRALQVRAGAHDMRPVG